MSGGRKGMRQRIHPISDCLPRERKREREEERREGRPNPPIRTTQLPRETRRDIQRQRNRLENVMLHSEVMT